MKEQILTAENITKAYKEGKSSLTIFDGIDFSLEKGESVAILGSSGAGKTTLLNILGGVDLPTSGKVTIAGVDYAGLSEKKRGLIRNRFIGFVYQFHHLLPEFSALENVAMPALIGGESPRQAKIRSLDLLAKVGLEARVHHKPAELSGGERQRVAIARALVNNPACVMMDEPTGNLDETTAQKVQALIFSLQQELETSFVVVTHDQRLASRLNRVLRLENGRLVSNT
ncbi:MAG: lipoprotein-releasing ABC transporter ATP-binding protein LolD [Hahellaceae bacterium]|nr:lipoprotein-releasing ABC transporter ATP-binding protein LolD [Hahellaceae bacterium]